MNLSNLQKEQVSSLSNRDLLPVPPTERTWKTQNFASMWMGVINNIPTYATIGGLVVLGFSPWQVIGIIFTASLILYVALTLNGHAGSKYGIPFPVLIRTSYGILGANIPALLRGVVAIMWLGIQAYAGSAAFNIAFTLLWPGWAELGGGWTFLGIGLPGLLSFLLFWSLHFLVLKRGMESLKKFQGFTGPLVYIVLAGLLWWAIDTAGGVKPIFMQPGKYETFGEAFFPFISAVAGIIGIWSTLILNIPDFTRFSRSQTDQIKGQLYGLPVTFTIFTFVTVAATAATTVAFGKPIGDIILLLQQFDRPIVIVIAALILSAATITVNVIANLVSPAYDLANLFPKWITFKRGFYITMMAALFTFPWKLMENADAIFTLLNLIGGALGPIAGVMIADYYIIRKRELNVNDIYSLNGEYTYFKGYNYRAFAATLFGAAVALIGVFVPSLRELYDISWFLGVVLSFASYIGLMRLHPPASATGEKGEIECEAGNDAISSKHSSGA
ncbi:NCS1 family nucleobase:cation symporter-1 [Pseudobacillus wudalianchiensis]|uniref:Allantoin permease n=1 Tax=Pseudobacillus wudalianchiensis TaxID=1743143 RepID=A0A1B9ADY1_9BACI|nr:NCS1 family nucleobase:cation symporter-1 [Bacillus wudalianchiensis]OCA82042.1 allantoin permease [Bacillus wudalianchiensis]